MNKSTVAPLKLGSGRRIGVYIAVALAAVLMVALISGCGARKPSQPASQAGKQGSPGKASEKPATPVALPERDKVGVTTKNVTLTWEEAGKLKMQATAREIIGNQLTGKGEMHDAKVLWYDKGQLTTVMQAPRIDAENATKVLLASGGVTVKSIPRNTVVKARQLKFYANDHKIIGSGGVKVTSDMGTVNATGLVADTELKTIKFTAQNGSGSASFKP